ncbi:MAG: YdjY domain-containing protein [Verrucomicrobiales bacterium]
MTLSATLLTAGAQDGEPSPKQKPAAEKRPIKIGGDEYRFGEILFNRKTREIRFPAEVIQNEVVLEYGLVHAVMGKVHESLLATEINPIDLQIVMKLLRYQESERDIWPEYNEDGVISKPMEDDGKGRVEFFITTGDKDGKKSTFPLSDWIESRSGPEGQEREIMPKERFAYTGSDVWEGSYIAENEGAFAAIYRYAGAMFNSFQSASDNDDIWFPKEGAVPAIGTVVELSIRPLPDTRPSDGWKARQAARQPEADPPSEEAKPNKESK